jgi:hypothetical protein
VWVALLRSKNAKIDENPISRAHCEGRKSPRTVTASEKTPVNIPFVGLDSLSIDLYPLDVNLDVVWYDGRDKAAEH